MWSIRISTAHFPLKLSSCNSLKLLTNGPVLRSVTCQPLCWGAVAEEERVLHRRSQTKQFFLQPFIEVQRTRKWLFQPTLYNAKSHDVLCRGCHLARTKNIPLWTGWFIISNQGLRRWVEKSQNIVVRFGKKKKKNQSLCLLRMSGSFVPLRGSARRLDQSVAQKLGYLLI